MKVRQLALGTISAVLLASLQGCGLAPVKVEPAQIVTRTVYQYVPIPAADKHECGSAQEPGVTNGDLWDAYWATRATLEKCGAQVHRIINLKVPPTATDQLPP